MLFDNDTLRDMVILQIRYLFGWRRRWSRAGQEKMCSMERGRLLSQNLFVKGQRLVARRWVRWVQSRGGLEWFCSNVMVGGMRDSESAGVVSTFSSLVMSMWLGTHMKIVMIFTKVKAGELKLEIAVKEDSWSDMMRNDLCWGGGILIIVSRQWKMAWNLRIRMEAVFQLWK